MTWIVENLWLIPALPLAAAGVSALLPREQRRASAGLAIGAMGVSFVLACIAFAATLGGHGEMFRELRNFDWFDLGAGTMQLGWVLDPLAAVMLVMVSFVGLLIFIYSVGYMAHDDNFTRFFCFLSLFAAAMLGVVIANSLLLLFICWELVGLASYLLIGFWYHKPSAAAAAKKAFIVTRIGDLAFLIGMVWLSHEAGTLLFYDDGHGCLEQSALAAMVARTTGLGIAVVSCIGILVFCGAIGKSGQVPLHVWLPDAMEGPTPVSALIHAATMVAAGVFLVARVYPLMEAAGVSVLQVVTWVGAITALFASLIAVAQTDIKRILAYSTVSQLGYMMLGLGTGGVAVGMFHLITHAFFKALLFMGAGSVIHGCHEEQDIRRMGGLSRYMPVTFATYAAGMLALTGFPLFAGFWSKDEILHAAHGWPVSSIPFYLGLFGALLTAFYMTRQVALVFFGSHRGCFREKAAGAHDQKHQPLSHESSQRSEPHESPKVMTVPLVILAVFALLLGFAGTPFAPWFQTYLGAEHGEVHVGSVLGLMGISILVVGIGYGLGWWFYGRTPVVSAEAPDPMERLRPDYFRVLRDKFYIDELYDVSVVRLHGWWARTCDWMDRALWGGAVQLASLFTLGLSWLSRFADEYLINWGFDEACGRLRGRARALSRMQNGSAHRYLRVIAVALVALVLLLGWRWAR